MSLIFYDNIYERKKKQIILLLIKTYHSFTWEWLRRKKKYIFKIYYIKWSV